MKLSIGLVTDGRWDDMRRFVDTYNDRTFGHDRHELILIDNANFDKVDLESEWLTQFKTEDKRVIVNKERVSCASNWNELVRQAKHEMVVIVNDDSHFVKDGWDDLLEDRAAHLPGRGIFFLCQPNSFSGFGVWRRFWWKVGGMRDDYITAGLEDEDFWLMMQKTHGYTSSKELLATIAYSFPVHEKMPLVTHVPFMQSKYRREYWMRDHKNKPVFDKFWRKINGDEWRTIKDSKEGYGLVLEGKAGCRYVYIGP